MAVVQGRQDQQWANPQDSLWPGSLDGHRGACRLYTRGASIQGAQAGNARIIYSSSCPWHTALKMGSIPHAPACCRQLRSKFTGRGETKTRLEGACSFFTSGESCFLHRRKSFDCF